MASLTTHKLFIDLMSGNAYKGWNDFSSAGTPVFYYESTAKLELYLVRQTTSAAFPMESVAFPSSTITAKIGIPGSSSIDTSTTWTSISTPAASWSSPTLTVPSEATGGYYTLTLTYASPALTATTASLTKTSGAADISAAIVAAVNAQSGWSAASATVTQTGDGKYTIVAKATNSSTVYTLTVAVTSSLTGASGYSGKFNMTSASIGTELGTELSINQYLEVKCNDGSAEQTFLQIPCIVRNRIN